MLKKNIGTAGEKRMKMKEIMLVREEREDEFQEQGLKKGQWTLEEDSKLSTFIAIHGRSNWNLLARLVGLKRSGKSCRLRWLNYLRPNLRRGNFTLEEQLLILQLQFRWGNRWSKIAMELPGRTDNEIKNYWRTKVQKLAKQFGCDANSPLFREALLHTWMPRLVEKIRATKPSQSTLHPFINGPIVGPKDPFNEPNNSSMGFLFDTSSMDSSSVRPVEPNMYETHVSSSSATGLDYNQPSEHITSNDYPWELLLDDQNDLFFTGPY